MAENDATTPTDFVALERVSRVAYGLAEGTELTIRLPEERRAGRPTVKGGLGAPVALVEYNGVRMELGLEDSDEANSDDIISLYNELVEEGTPLISYSEYGTEGKFYNEDDDEIPTDVVLDEINYAIGLDGDENELEAKS